MNRFWKNPMLWLVVTCILGLIQVAANIDWTFHAKPIWQLKVEGETVELGLRDDGVVVWRRITQTTNSPAERQDLHIWTNYWWFTNEMYWTNMRATNLWLTNKDYNDAIIPTR